MAQNVRMGALYLTMKQRIDPPENDASRARSQVDVADLLQAALDQLKEFEADLQTGVED